MKAYRYRIYPNAVQQALLEQHFGSSRVPLGIGSEESMLSGAEKKLFKSERQRLLVASKKAQKPWLAVKSIVNLCYRP